MKAAGTVAGADYAEPGALVQGEAGGVLGKNARPQAPDTCSFGSGDQGGEQGQADASATDGRVKLHGVLDHAGIGGAAWRRVRPRTGRHGAGPAALSILLGGGAQIIHSGAAQMAGPRSSLPPRRQCARRARPGPIT